MAVIGLKGWRRSKDLGSKKILHFTLELGRRSSRANPAFFIPLSSAQVKALERYRETWPEKTKPGVIRIRWNEKNRSLAWMGFFPFGRGKDMKERKQMLQDTPTRIRIGSLVHHAVTEYLAKHFRSHFISHSTAISQRRRGQLRAMNIDHNRIYKIEEYRDIVRRYMAKKFG